MLVLIIVCRFPAYLNTPEPGCSPVVYFPCLAQHGHDMAGRWSLPAASILLLQIALSLEAPAGGKHSVSSAFHPSDEEKPVL